MRKPVGVRELRNQIGKVLERVRRGETITLTDRHEPLALLVPLQGLGLSERLAFLVEAGRLSWSGGKPRGCRRPPRVRGPSVAAAVLEDRA